MSEFKHLMNKYSGVSDTSDMEMLTDVIDHMFDEVDEDMRKKYLMKIKLYNKHIPLDRWQAEYMTSKMHNKDGTTGPHWDYDTAVKAMEDYDFDECEWYVTLNMVYSDYYNERRTLDNYKDLAYDFLADEDAPDCKVKRYWIAMHSWQNR